MNFTFLTLFDTLIKEYFEDSILSRAIKKDLISIDFINPREYTLNKHKKVDDYQVGGGAGLLLMAQPLFDAIKSIKDSDPSAYIIFPTPAGKPFKQIDAKRLSKKSHIVFVSGRYEGIDERVIEKYADELFSIGDFILTGGELASLCMCDAISRNVSGVLGNKDSLSIESFELEQLEAPAFTKPNQFDNREVIKEYLKGNHSKIHTLKNRLAIYKTQFFRPDLYQKIKINSKQRKNNEK